MNVDKIDIEYRLPLPCIISFYYALKIRDVFYLSPYMDTMEATIVSIGRGSERKDIQHALYVRYISQIYLELRLVQGKKYLKIHHYLYL